MFCPICRAEYRPGFGRCSDCGVDLVELLPPPEARDAETARNERPELAPPAHFPAWFLPLMCFVVLVGGVSIRPELFKSECIAAALYFLVLAQNVGGYWMLYQAVRYERRLGKYVLLSLVPFLFVWYSLVRIPLRREFQGNSSFVR
jgi:hypothetical protein